MIEVLGIWVAWFIIKWAIFETVREDWDATSDYYKQIPRRID